MRSSHTVNLKIIRASEAAGVDEFVGKANHFQTTQVLTNSKDLLNLLS